MTSCTHLDRVRVTQLPESVQGCEECLKTGDPWLHLRMRSDAWHDEPRHLRAYDAERRFGFRDRGSLLGRCATQQDTRTPKEVAHGGRHAAGVRR
jgi:hypothetical protein